MPPRAPYPSPRDLPPRNGSTREDSRRPRSDKPSVTPYHRATINGLVKDYLDDDSTKGVSNKDYATITSMVTLYMQDFASNQHPVHTLAAFEQLMYTTADVPSEQAQIASFSAASICAAIAPSDSPSVATICSSAPLLLCSSAPLLL